MSKHTEGLWTSQTVAEFRAEGHNCPLAPDTIAVVSSPTHVLAEIPGCNVEHGETADETAEILANARLMAAAPELYEFLFEFVTSGAVKATRECDELIADARKVLAKAKQENP